MKDIVIEQNALRIVKNPTYLDPIEINLGTRKYFFERFGTNIVHHTIPENVITFNGVLDYYQTCYNNHYGVVIDPVHLWHIILYEVATYVSNNVEKCRSLFTDSPDKKEISIPGVPCDIDLDIIVEQLKKLIPTNIDIFIPGLSTYTKDSYLGICGAFCDLVSPYYDYFTFACGFPSIKVVGSDIDWAKIVKSTRDIGELIPDLKNYLDRVANTFIGISEGDSEWLLRVFSTEREGSGSYLHITGWLKDLFIDNTPKRISNFPNIVSKINFKHLSTDQSYTMFTGVMFGTLEDGYIIPSYGRVVNEIK